MSEAKVKKVEKIEEVGVPGVEIQTHTEPSEQSDLPFEEDQEDSSSGYDGDPLRDILDREEEKERRKTTPKEDDLEITEEIPESFELVEEEAPPEEQEEERDEEKDRMDEVIKSAFDTDMESDQVMKMISKIDKNLGITAIEDPNKYDPSNILETIFHTMRWSPGYINEISINQLCEWEACLAAHCYYVRSKENHWGCLCDMMKGDMGRAIKLLSTVCLGKTVAEREAVAMSSHTQLQDMQKKLNVYNLYREKCRKLSDMAVQMDNSLKKTIEVRRSDLFHGHQKQQA